MPEEIEITVANQLITEKRALNGYHHSSRSSYMISPGNSKTTCLQADENGDYLHLSVTSGPGSLEQDCWINLPSRFNFTVCSLGNGCVVHLGARTLIKIPPGPPVWQLKITCSSADMKSHNKDHITIGDIGYKPDKELETVDFDTLC